jgi:hypothetical protein
MPAQIADRIAAAREPFVKKAMGPGKPAAGAPATAGLHARWAECLISVHPQISLMATLPANQTRWSQLLALRWVQLSCHESLYSLISAAPHGIFATGPIAA